MTVVYVSYFMDVDTPIFDGVCTSLEAAKKLAHTKLNEGIQKEPGEHRPFPEEEETMTWLDLPDGEGADCDFDNGQWLVECRIRRTEMYG